MTKKQNCIEMLVGMLDDYNGRHFITEKNDEPVLLASFYSNEEETFNIFMSYLNLLFPKSNFITKPNFIIKQEVNYYIYSKNKATLFNEYYTYNKEKIGYLNEEKFNTDEKKINFILGTFIRNGRINEKGEIIITFSNSLSHFQAIHNFVNKLNWQVIKSENTGEYSIPQIQKINFVTNKEILKKFTTLSKLSL